MTFALIHREFLLFAVGLCLMALAGFGGLHSRAHAPRRGWPWLAGALALLGLSDWIMLLGQHRHDWPVCRVAALLCTLGALVVLVELGCQKHRARTAGGFGRWLYAPLAIGMIAGMFLVDWSWLEYSARALLAWQGGAMLLRYLLQDQAELRAPGERELTIAAWAMLAYLPLQVVQLNILALLPLSVALAMVFVADRKLQSATGSVTIVRKLGIPTAVLVALLTSWFVFAPQSASMLTVHMAAAEVESSDVVVATSPAAMMLWKVGLAILPIGLMIALFAGLKRVPGVH